MDERQVSLRARAPVLHRVEQFGIEPSQAGQLLGVEFVTLAP